MSPFVLPLRPTPIVLLTFMFPCLLFYVLGQHYPGQLFFSIEVDQPSSLFVHRNWKYIQPQLSPLSLMETPLESSVPSWVFWDDNTTLFAKEAALEIDLPSTKQLKALQKARGGYLLSQDGEEVYAMDHFFSDLHSGIVLESGALDGKMYSVSWALTEYWGWNAVHVEGFKKNYLDLVANRPEQLNIQAALCNSTIPLHWVQYDDTTLTSINGFWEVMSLEVKEKWFPALTPEVVETLPQTTCRPLSSLLGLFGIPHIDLWVLDIEGSEWMALSSVDWDSIIIDVISVEVLEPRTQVEQENEALVRSIILDRGYQIHSVQGRNMWYYRNGFMPKGCNEHPILCMDAVGWNGEAFRERVK